MGQSSVLSFLPPQIQASRREHLPLPVLSLIPGVMIPTMLSRRLLSKSSPSAAVQFPFSFRNRSSRSGKLIEIDLDSALHSSSSTSSSSLGEGDGEAGAIGIRGLEESINCILALRYTPDWIPFLPGASFWVPPRTVSAVQYLGSLASAVPEDESLSFASPRAWPCFESISQIDASSTKTFEIETQNDVSRPQGAEILVEVRNPSQGGSESGDDE